MQLHKRRQGNKLPRAQQTRHTRHRPSVCGLWASLHAHDAPLLLTTPRTRHLAPRRLSVCRPAEHTLSLTRTRDNAHTTHAHVTGRPRDSLAHGFAPRRRAHKHIHAHVHATSLWPVTSGSQVAPTSPHPRPFPHNNGRRGLELLASPRGSALLPSPRMQTLATASSLPPLTRTAPTAHHPSPHLLPLPRCCPAAAGRSRLAHRARSARRPFSEARESLATRRPWA